MHLITKIAHSVKDVIDLLLACTSFHYNDHSDSIIIHEIHGTTILR
jgi:hypothetical protein